MPVGSHASAYRAVELLKRILPNTGLFVGRDVGRKHLAKGRRKFASTRHRWPLVGRVAGKAITQSRDVFTALDHRCFRLGPYKRSSGLSGLSARSEEREKAENRQG